MYTYDSPLVETVDLADAQAAVSVSAVMGNLSSVNILGASAVVGSSAAVVKISIGDGTTADKYGTIDIPNTGSANKAASVTLNLTDAGRSIINQKGDAVIKFTNTAAPENAVVSLKVILGHY